MNTESLETTNDSNTKRKGPRINKIPDGDSRHRLVCPDCDFIQYENPRIIAGAVVVWKEKILLARRAIPPRRGFWTLPAGFMEIGESVGEGAARETLEETGAQIKVGQLLAFYDLKHIGQVHMIFRAELKDPDQIEAGIESLECRLFAVDEIPWSSLAFPTNHWALHQYLESKDQEVIIPFQNPPMMEVRPHPNNKR